MSFFEIWRGDEERRTGEGAKEDKANYAKDKGR